MLMGLTQLTGDHPLQYHASVTRSLQSCAYFCSQDVSSVFLIDILRSASLKSFAHDDVSVGSWMIGLEVTYVDDNRLCCAGTIQGKPIHPHP